MAQPPTNAGSLIGQRLDDYELVALLALGGTAEIYLARHAGLAGFEKYVVVKCLHDHLADDGDFVKMFLDEARLGARLDHSNIVQTTKLGEQKGRYYIVQEYLAGMSLSFVVRKAAERIPGGRLPVDLILNLMAQACYGLHYAHGRRDSDGNPLNMVHRDVSPQNLVISFEGVLKVVDFGIAKATVRDTRTQSGTIKGKFAYMSPEQCMAGDIDRRTDVFALGAITHELLTGKRLFKRESAYDTYHAILECNVEPPSRDNPELDPALDRVVLQALAKDRENRYPTAEAFGDALVAILHKHGKSVSHGAVAQFFEEFFAAEIDEHGQRMRALISGRKTTVDEHWDDEDAKLPAAPSGSEPSPKNSQATAEPPRASSGAYITTELSISDAALLGDEEQPGADDQGDDDGATRIEMNPLEQAQLRHGQLTGQIAQLGAGASKAGQAGSPGPRARPIEPAMPSPVEAVSRSTDKSVRTASQDTPSPFDTAKRAASGGGPARSRAQGPAAPSALPSGGGKFAAESLLSTQIAPDSAAQSPSPVPSPAPPIDDSAADAETLMAGDDQAAAVAAAVARMNAPGGASPGGKPAGKFPGTADQRTQIAIQDQPAKPSPVGLDSGPMVTLPPAGKGFPGTADVRTQIAQPDEPGSGQVLPAAGAGFPASADVRTQIAPTEAGKSEQHTLLARSTPSGAPSGTPSGDRSALSPPAGPSPFEQPPYGSNVPGMQPGMQPYRGMLDDGSRLPYPMPSHAQPMPTNTHRQLMDRLGPTGFRAATPVWLLVVIFAVAIGAGLGLTVLLASLF